MYNAENYDVAVVGGGHAGCEAALAAARLGLKTILFAINLDSVAMMPCNPSIGGTSKGHLVREIDALGGEMGKNTDKTFIQSRLLNTAKGPAVYSLRAQADKYRYKAEMKHVLELTEGLFIRQAEIVDIAVEEGRVTGVISSSGAIYGARAVVLATGTYLMARCLFGETITESGPNGLMRAGALSESLKKLGIKLFRFKTGTPARVLRSSVDFEKMQREDGDAKILPFSFENSAEKINRKQIPCYLTYTNEKTHEIIRANLHRSPLYAGVIEGTGTRYCPSIEDKVVRFADKLRHQLFIEPEGEDTEELYVQGMSSSLPEDVQIAMYRTIPGLENCQFTRTAYAIEYDCIDASQLKLSLEFRDIAGLFAAGQINGSSGYEEAAAQGLIAGINAAKYIRGQAPLILRRSDAYIGVLIDDLTTKGNREPYRMMTSRAEYRLLLRQDNADMRLTPIGYEIGLISEERYARFLEKKAALEAEIKRLESVIVKPDAKTNELLLSLGTTAIKTGARLSELLRRPGMSYEKLAPLDPARPALEGDIGELAEVEIKYSGYIEKQQKQVEQFKKLENKIIPPEMDFNSIHGLRLEARQKLSAIRPESVGRAGRIAGVSPGDIAVLLVALEQYKQKSAQ
ncbi:MAG: tRNA uridine-5-carboxymethylaminomethyl(34) synthesis enzyme MnmG [Firmicutes bacterium]|nr:tRNA uridine-5-carboxymethylaminomethyl(34) synthesis enzyme MnmG [Bacillota bacterium]